MCIFPFLFSFFFSSAFVICPTFSFSQSYMLVSSQYSFMPLFSILDYLLISNVKDVHR
jgi:hypothetical protein